MAPEDPIDPAALELLADGALTVRRAAEFSGISRSELFVLMRDGGLEWFRHGPYRLIVRRSLVAHLARLYAAEKRGAGART